MKIQRILLDSIIAGVAQHRKFIEFRLIRMIYLFQDKSLNTKISFFIYNGIILRSRNSQALEFSASVFSQNLFEHFYDDLSSVQFFLDFIVPFHLELPVSLVSKFKEFNFSLFGFFFFFLFFLFVFSFLLFLLLFSFLELNTSFQLVHYVPFIALEDFADLAFQFDFP